MRLGRGLLAMEELDEQATRVEPEALMPDAAEVEAVAAVDSAETEVHSELNDLDSGLEAAVTIDEVTDRVEDAAETEGGVSEPEARALNAAVEGILVLLGSPRNAAKVFPAFESFADTKTRLSGTKLAVENMREKLAALWKRIVEMVQSVWATITKFIKAIFTQVGRMEARAKKIKALAEKNKDAKGAEIAAQSNYALLTQNGKIASNLAGAIAELGTDPLISLDYGKLATDMNNVVVKLVDNVGQPDAREKSNEEMDRLMGLIKPLENASGDGGHALPLGGAKFMTKITTGENKFEITVELKAGEAKLGEKVQGLSASEAIAVVDAVLKDSAKFATAEKESEKIAATMKSLSAKLSGAMSKIGKGDEKQAQANAQVRQVIAGVRLLKAATARASSLLYGYNVNTLKAATDFAGASVKAMTASAKKTEGETAAA